MQEAAALRSADPFVEVARIAVPPALLGLQDRPRAGAERTMVQECDDRVEAPMAGEL